jgi:UDPglucose 6-dehydrogenase
VRSLLDQGASVVAFDPAAMDHALPLMPGLERAKSAKSVADGADALVIVTEWDEFRALDLAKLAKKMRGRSLIDLRNVYDPDEAERAGLDYRGIGRRSRPRTAVRAAAE